MRSLYVLFILFALLQSPTVLAAKEANGAKAVAKLQTMVKEITAERDSLKAQLTQVSEQAQHVQEDLKKQAEQLKLLQMQASTDKEHLTAELRVQKSSYNSVQQKLNDSLNQWRTQYEQLSHNHQALTASHTQLDITQKNTAQELNNCVNKNRQLYDTTRHLIDQFQHTQSTSFIDKVMNAEPVLNLDEVEKETLLQTFHDQADKQKYLPKNP